jgi:hypothetical protein
MHVPNPEQDAPLISLILFQFLDPLVFKAYKVEHLPYDELPPLADYDYVQFLKEKRFKVRDPLCRNEEYKSIIYLTSAS